MTPPFRLICGQVSRTGVAESQRKAVERKGVRNNDDMDPYRA